MSIEKMGKLLTILAAATFLFACASKSKVEEKAVEPVKEVAAPVEPVETAEEAAIRMNNEARAAAGTVVYFDLDDDVVSEQGKKALEAHAWFLSQTANASTVVTVAGHCDERGTPAYNLALGERRAKSVAQVLMSYGVSASQIKTVSHGEEMPAVEGHDESAWSKNRRAALDYAE
ncbi:MAG: OmpA family protein [Enterobacterales bacterium]|nr:OmpA family protein [Enterobacterales bacterium]